MHLHGLSYVPEIIKTELTTEKTRHLVARKCFEGLQLLHTDWKDISHDSDGIAYVIGRLRITIRSLLSSTG